MATGTPGSVIHQGHGLVMAVAVAIGATDSLAIPGQCPGQWNTGLGIAVQHRLQGIGVHGLHHPVEGGFGHRFVQASPSGSSRPRWP